MEWSEPQRAKLAQEYERIGYRPGELWPAPPPEMSPTQLLALFQAIPDGGGREGYIAQLRRSVEQGSQ